MRSGSSTDDDSVRLERALNIDERQRFGLDSSDAAIATARAHPLGRTTRLGGATCWWTPEERALIAEKCAASFEVELDLSPLSDEALRHFAGAVPDLTLPRGGWLVGFTQAGDSFVELLRPGFRYPDRLFPFRAEVSLAELEQIEVDIASSTDEFLRRGLEPSGTEIDVRRNRIAVGVTGIAGDEASVGRWLMQRFGPVELLVNVSIGTAPFSSFDSGAPRRD